MAFHQLSYCAKTRDSLVMITIGLAGNLFTKCTAHPVQERSKDWVPFEMENMSEKQLTISLLITEEQDLHHEERG